MTFAAAVALSFSRAEGATQLSSVDYDLYVGDFNGDGKADILYVAKGPDKPSGIALADASGVPQMGFQSWSSDYLNIPWSNGSYKAVIGDFNGDGCSDILLQSQSPGTSYILLANCDLGDPLKGEITGVAQAIPQNYLGLAWSADQHRILTGDFDGDGKTDLFLQASTPGGTNAIVLADGSGGLFIRTTSNCWAWGPQQCWGDGYEGFNWSAKAATVYVGDFNGDHKSDLLIISQPTFVMIDYDVPFPVPKFAEHSDGILLAQSINANGTIFRLVNQLFNSNGLGANFSPLITNAIVGDFNGDGISDVLLQSKGAGRSNLILYGDSNGQLDNAVTPAANVASWTGDNYQILAGHFGNSRTSVLYLQARSASGINFLTSSVSQVSVDTTASNLVVAGKSPPLASGAAGMASAALQIANGVGATVGTAGVSSNGTGQYTIPLELPRGTAGMTPELALAYQHSATNGLLGVGWGISGLSVITRCAQTVAQDGVSQGVQYSASDQYCLDGNRLERVSGTQGAAGSKYRTELETYSLITAVGVGTNGPQSFEVLRKDGRVYDYGNSSDSRIPGTNGTRVWALNQIRDRAETVSAGNAITFSYINDTTHGTYRPNQITYAGNSSKGTSAPYSIQFFYQARNSGEVLARYYLGQQITEVNRLSEIQLSYGATIVRTWYVGYDGTVTPSNSSRITSIQECGENNDCFPATTFAWSTQAWGNNAPAIASTEVGTPPTGSTCPLFYNPVACVATWSMDLDGDGVPDFVVGNGLQAPNSLTVFWGTPKGQTPRNYTDLSAYVNPNSGIGQPPGGFGYDALSDGKQSFTWLYGECPTLQTCWAHDPSGTTSISVDPAPSGGWPNGMQLIDVNGDGFQDEIIFEPNDFTHVYLALRNSDGTNGYKPQQLAWTAPSGYTMASSPSWNPIPIGNEILTADFDGDGRQDMLVQTTSGWLVLYSNGSGFTTGDLIVPELVSGQLQAYQAPVLIDINGDGCTDLVYPSYGTNSAGYHTWIVQLSKCGIFGGSGFTPPADTGFPAPVTTNNPYDVGFSAVDLNGDGYQDLVYPDPTNYGAPLIAYSNGTGLSGKFSTPVGAYWSDEDGDGLPDANGGNSSPGYFSAVGPKSDLMLSATDGFGNAVNFTYAPLTDPTVYTRGQGQMGVTQDMSGSMYVVKQVQSTDGVGGQYTLTYAYAGAHRNVQGRGFLGFATRTETDSRTGFITIETYNNTTDNLNNGWELAGTLKERKVQQSAGGPTLSDTINSWLSYTPTDATQSRYPYIQSQTVKTYELSNTGTPVSTKTTSTTIDNYGTPTDVVVTTTENSTGLHPGSSSTVESYSPSVMNDTADWCLSKPTSTQIKASHTLADGAQVVQSISQTWDGLYCRLTDKNLDVGSSWELDTHYDYDAWNNVLHQVVKATNLPQGAGGRTTTFDYTTGATTPGQFLMRMTNALSQTTTFTWNTPLGVKATETDPNGFTTFWYYDDFGRFAHEVRPDGTGSRRTYSVCNSSNNYCGDALLRYMVQEDERDVNDALISYQYLFYDSLGRVKYDETLGFSGSTLSVVQTSYDQRGNVTSRSFPYYQGIDPIRTTSYLYDLYDRMTQSQHAISDSNPQLATTIVTYNGLTVITQDPLTHTRTQFSTAWGTLIQVTDETGNNTKYTYGGFGNLKSTTDAKGNATTLTYTDRGFKLSSSDPDLGAWSYTYDGLGEMLTQTDAKSQQTKFHYDALGRMDNRTDPGSSSPDSVWNWDTATNGIGQLGSVTGPNSYSEQFSYGGSGTATGKVIATTLNSSTLTFGINYTFDPTLGKLQTITYPTSKWPGNVSQRLAVWYDYQNGYVKDVHDYTNGTAGTVYWTANAQDARGHVTQETYGNNWKSNLYFDETNGHVDSISTGPNGSSATQNLVYNWDAVGNLLSREDANQGLTESFQYDALDRLTTVTGPQPLTVSYNGMDGAIGNITNKSDVGSYDYTTQQGTCNYTGLPAQPHAVRKAGSTVYCYDANGNMTSRAGASISWYAYNQPQTINQSGGNYSTFYYAPDRSRYRQTSRDGSATHDRYYVAGVFERDNSSTDGMEYRNYIIANGETVAIRLMIPNTSINDTLYLHTDHLGSTDAITDQTGSVRIHESFDAWGKRRGSAWTGSPSAGDVNTINKTTHLGFTGQEHLDNLSLVDLNGRVYDPAVARFMSADPYVQAPYASQSLNRYSYTLDNPLNATDPTGFAACTGSHIETFDVGDLCPNGQTTAYATSAWEQDSYDLAQSATQMARSTLSALSTAATSTDVSNSASAQNVPGVTNLQSADAQDTADRPSEVGVKLAAVELDWAPPSIEFAIDTVGSDPANSPPDVPSVQDLVVTAPRPTAQSSGSQQSGGLFGLVWRALGGHFFECLLGESCSASRLLSSGAEFAAVIVPGELEVSAGLKGAASAANIANKIIHIFREGKNLDEVIRASGSPEAAYHGVQQAANEALQVGVLKPGPRGILPGAGKGAILNVNGVNVQLIGGRVMNGVVQIGSFVGVP